MKVSEADIAVIVRSVDERTTKHCAILLGKYFPAANIRILHSVPFSKAIADAWALGRAMSKPWTLCIDADVLVTSYGLHSLLSKASSLPDEVFALQGLVLDKFFPILRPAGNHLYRTSLTEKAVGTIPLEGTSIRPETDMLNRMAMVSHPWMQCDSVVGVHDYEQSYADIFRKCFLQARKHASYREDVLPYWNSQAGKDADFQVGIYGWVQGEKYDGKVFVDKRFFKDEIDQVLLQKGISEKADPDFANVVDPDQTVQKYLALNSWEPLQSKMYPRSRWNEFVDQHYLQRKLSKPMSLKDRIKKKFNKALQILSRLFV